MYPKIQSIKSFFPDLFIGKNPLKQARISHQFLHSKNKILLCIDILFGDTKEGILIILNNFAIRIGFT